jgi:hypothetical protein
MNKVERFIKKKCSKWTWGGNPLTDMRPKFHLEEETPRDGVKSVCNVQLEHHLRLLEPMK